MIRTVKVGLIGADIQASKSPALHEHEAAAQGFDYTYELIDFNVRKLGVEALPVLLKEVEERGFSGVNITFPVKQAVIQHLTKLSPEAEALGAVNTVVFREGERYGYNTDWYGFYENFRVNFSDVDTGCALLLGAGGAGSAVAHAALSLGIKKLLISDVDIAKANDLAERLSHEFSPDRLAVADNIESAMHPAKGLIHATPAGMKNYPEYPLDPSLLKRHHWVADIVYMPLETPLLAYARKLGCHTLGGGGMVVYQAAAALQHFAGIEADHERMLRHFHSLVQPQS